MQTATLPMKLQPPEPPPDWLDRPRLINWLNQHIDRRLCFLPAPFASGKSQLLRAWTQQTNTPWVWLTLDIRDRNPQRLCFYLVHALRRSALLGKDWGASLLDDCPQNTQADAEPWIAQLLSSLQDHLSQPLVWILDDLHWLDLDWHTQLLTQLIEQAPPQLHFIAASETCLDLPLERWQLTQHLARLDAESLHLTPVEFKHWLLQREPATTRQQRTLTYVQSQGHWGRLLMPRIESNPETPCPAEITHWLTALEQQHLTQAQRLFETTAHSSWEQDLLHHWQAWLNQESESSLQAIEGLLHPLSQTQPDAYLAALQLLTLGWQQKGQFRAARGYNRLADAWVLEQGDGEQRIAVQLDRIQGLLQQGQLVRAHSALTPIFLNSALSPANHARATWLQGLGYLQQGQLSEAETTLEQAVQLGFVCQAPCTLSALLDLSLLARLAGQRQEAFDCLEEAERLQLIWKLPAAWWQPRITLCKVPLWLDQGETDLSLAWLTQRWPLHPVSQHPLWVSARMHQVRALLCRQQYSRAQTLMDQLSASPLQTTEQQVQHHLLSALIHRHLRQPQEAVHQLIQALRLAAKDQFQLAFLLADASLTELLEAQVHQLPPGGDLHRLAEDLLRKRLTPRDHPTADPTRPLEALSSREQEVLEMVALGLTNQAIAERLYISLHTVKTHLRHLLKKLDVRTRTQAVTRARSLRLI